MDKITLKLPDGIFKLDDVEKLNAEINPTELRVQFGQAIARGYVEVVQFRKENGDRTGPLTYRKRA